MLRWKREQCKCRSAYSIVRMLLLCSLSIITLTLSSACAGIAVREEDWQAWDQQAFKQGIFGGVISVPEHFYVTHPLRGLARVHASPEAYEHSDLTIQWISVALCDHCSIPFGSEDLTTVGQRDYPGYVWVQTHPSRSPAGRAVYLVGAQWWGIIAITDGEEWTEADEQLFHSFISSIDHG
jgi:hypothetical protein